MKRKLIYCFAAFAILALNAAPSGAQALRGSRNSVDGIHRQAVNHGLRFFPSSTSIRTAAQRGELVALQGDGNYALVDVTHPYVLPETRTFIVRLAAQYRAACGEKLVVTSGTRPTSMRLANSVDKSVHPTGMAVDLRKPRNATCLNWLRNTLTAIETAGVIDAVEERSPPHFHVAVFPTPYSQYVQVRASGSSDRLASASATRTAVRTASTATRSAATASGATYRVRNGDSLWTIARRNNVSVERIKAVNDLRTSRILAGQVLRIP